MVKEGVPVEPVREEETRETSSARKLREEAILNDTMALQILQTAVKELTHCSSINIKKAWDALNAEYQSFPFV